MKMNKILVLILSITTLFANDIEIEQAQLRAFGTSIDVNAKIIQLSNQKQNIVSKLDGHLEKYYVKTGMSVKKGDKIALLSSLELSKMSAEFVFLKAELRASKTRLTNAQKLYEKGLASMNDLNQEQIAVANIKSKLESIKNQLKSMQINTKTLKKATDSFVIYAHADGKIEQLLVNLHDNVDAQTPIVSLTQERGYYAEAYVPTTYALDITKNAYAIVFFANKRYKAKFVTIFPHVDNETGQAKVLFWIESANDKLLLDAYVKMQIVVPSDKQYIAVKKSAITMFEGEWVVFVPTKDNDHGDEHKKEGGHDDHEDEHKEENDHDDHEEEAQISYMPKVIKIITTNDNLVAIKGLKKNEEYVSDGVYFVKSLLLKASLGEHGH